MAVQLNQKQWCNKQQMIIRVYKPRILNDTCLSRKDDHKKKSGPRSDHRALPKQTFIHASHF